MTERMLVVLAYDSPDDRRRQRIARLLEEVAERVQWSVFEGWLTEDEMDRVWQRLLRVVDAGQDKLRLYRACAYCRGAARTAGGTPLRELPEIWIV